MGILALICTYCYTSRTIDEKHFFLPHRFHQVSVFRDHLEDIQEEALYCLDNALLSPIVQACTPHVQLRDLREDMPQVDGWAMTQPDGHHTPDNRWLHYGLMVNGILFSTNARRCPTLARILLHLRQYINVCGFSLLMPNSQIAAHTDKIRLRDNSLACHLGLIVPPKKCTLYVGKREMKEKNGRAIVFDSNITHYAANTSDSVRVILYIDFSLCEKHHTYSQSY